MLIELRAPGRASRVIDSWTTPPPSRGGEGDGSVTLRQLISGVVRDQIEAFRRRASRHRLDRMLTATEIDDAAAGGKVDPGGRPLRADVDPDAAVGAALQAFQDAMYLVIIDGVEQTDLDAQVFVREDSQLVFVRLVFLAGA
jgi:hypothetical protein